MTPKFNIQYLFYMARSIYKYKIKHKQTRIEKKGVENQGKSLC